MHLLQSKTSSLLHSNNFSAETTNAARRDLFKAKITEMLDRAEQLKFILDKQEKSSPLLATTENSTALSRSPVRTHCSQLQFPVRAQEDAQLSAEAAAAEDCEVVMNVDGVQCFSVLG